MMEKVDTYPIYVEPFHVDFTGHIFMGVLGNHLLNAAGNHSQRRGWGIGALNESSHTWVLSRLSIEMTELPCQYEHIEIKTWVESVIKLFTNRNFAIQRPDGTPRASPATCSRSTTGTFCAMWWTRPTTCVP